MALDVAAFDFTLPPDRIAQHPARPRDTARLLHVSRDCLADRVVRDLPQLLRPGDVLVANDTRVIPAQLTARRGAARIGITLDRPRADGAWHALARNARRLHAGDLLRFDGADDLTATVMEREPDGGVALAFNRQGEAFAAALRQAGALALPPYIARPQGPLPEDASDYQTVFAAREGAVAAPTAGLHFTPAMLAALAARGIRRVTLTLHVGAGTFLPVRGDDIARHRIHAEYGEITPSATAAINAARAAGGRVVAVGTTSVRLLETAADDAGRIVPFAGDTELFILPGYRFRAVDLLLTNFHLPRSTLFMLVCAFAGTARMRAAYAHAIAASYRFYSYGDACLLESSALTHRPQISPAASSPPRAAAQGAARPEAVEPLVGVVQVPVPDVAQALVADEVQALVADVAQALVAGGAQARLRDVARPAD
jgi:S-adenosylmethionine:tRNA ribosyltransferase-isomerase